MRTELGCGAGLPAHVCEAPYNTGQKWGWGGSGVAVGQGWLSWAARFPAQVPKCLAWTPRRRYKRCICQGEKLERILFDESVGLIHIFQIYTHMVLGLLSVLLP